MRAAASAALVASALVLALVGCGEGDRGTGAPGYDGPVSVVRSGGIAGVRDTVELAADGDWRRTTRRAGPGAGTLTADQRTRVQRWLADPALREEATRTVPAIGCADGFDYELTAGSTVVRWSECGPEHPVPEVSANIAHLLLDSAV